MKRRQFVRLAGGVVVSVGVAGCTGSASEPGVSETVVKRVPGAEEGDEQTVRIEVDETDSDRIEVDDLSLQHEGLSGVFVSGNAENTGDRTFEDFFVEVTIYDENEAEDDLLDSREQQTEHDNFDPGETWEWEVEFPDSLPQVDYYAVTARGKYD